VGGQGCWPCPDGLRWLDGAFDWNLGLVQLFTESNSDRRIHARDSLSGSPPNRLHR
jgi:hypothetical protein